FAWSVNVAAILSSGHGSAPTMNSTNFQTNMTQTPPQLLAPPAPISELRSPRSHQNTTRFSFSFLTSLSRHSPAVAGRRRINSLGTSATLLRPQSLNRFSRHRQGTLDFKFAFRTSNAENERIAL